MKKIYSKPTMIVVKLQAAGLICGSEVKGVSNNEGINYTGGGNGEVNVKEHNVWDDEW